MFCTMKRTTKPRMPIVIQRRIFLDIFDSFMQVNRYKLDFNRLVVNRPRG